MKLKTIAIGAILGVAVAAVALGSASSTGAAAKPGLPAGTWKGTGVISGSFNDGGATTKFSGKLGFQFRVAKDRYVKGKGSWVRTMEGRSEFINSDLTGIADLIFAGPSNAIEIYYEELVEGTVHDEFTSKPTPVKFQRGSHADAKPLLTRLVIKRVKRCTAAGTMPAVEGMTITWTAKARGCKA